MRQCAVYLLPWGDWRPSDPTYTIQIIAKDNEREIPVCHFADMNSFRGALGILGMDIAAKNKIERIIEMGEKYTIGHLEISDEALERFQFPAGLQEPPTHS